MKSGNDFYLDRIMREHGRRPAVVTGEDITSWAALNQKMRQWRSALKKSGVASGETCAVHARPGVDFIALLLAMWGLGVVAAPLNRRLPAQRMTELAKRVGRKIITDESSEEKTHPGLDCLPFEELHRACRRLPADATEAVIPLRQPATLIFTSGSSGESKACLHTFGNHYFNALGANKNMPLQPGDRWLLSLPLYHVAGIAVIFRCLLSGAAMAVPTPESNLVKALQRLEPTHISLVATQLRRLLDDKGAVAYLQTMKAILLGGGPVPEALIRRAVNLGLPIFTSYGSTEMASQTTTTRPGDSVEHLLTGGRVLPHREVRIGKDGEILVRGACLALGYVHDGTVTPLADADGWFHTRDVGFVDDDGCLHIRGRLDDMFISGGENIFPEEIEKEMQRLPGVLQVVVAPIPDDEFGRRAAAFVKVKEGLSLGDIDLTPLRQVLPGYKIPSTLLPWPENYTSSGIKIERAFFRELAEKLAT